ncbi:MAG TPA: hypothetical protein VN259_16975 [Xanthomonadales bacterium]|nr:hypothetical protein [Xanthomonadales bacterium]
MGAKSLALAQALLLATSMAAAAPAGSDLDAQAREALRTGQYQRTLALTREIAQADPLSAQNWYHMAVAAQKESDLTLAARALQTAERLDPVAFAPGDERVKSLKALIDASSSASAPAASANAPAASPAPAPAAARLDSMVPHWILYGISMAVLILAALGVMVRSLAHATREYRRARQVEVATMPLDDLIALCRDNLALLRQRLDYHGHNDTELAALLTRLQPAFARECGRSRLQLEDLKDGRPMADVTHELGTRIPMLGAFGPEQVHKDAVAQALQKQRRA